MTNTIKQEMGWLSSMLDKSSITEKELKGIATELVNASLKKEKEYQAKLLRLKKEIKKLKRKTEKMKEVNNYHRIAKKERLMLFGELKELIDGAFSK